MDYNSKLYYTNLHFVYVCFTVRSCDTDHVWAQLQAAEQWRQSTEALYSNVLILNVWHFQIAPTLTLHFLWSWATQLQNSKWRKKTVLMIYEWTDRWTEISCCIVWYLSWTLKTFHEITYSTVVGWCVCTRSTLAAKRILYSFSKY